MNEHIADYALIVEALRSLHEAVRQARNLALGGEYEEGGLWQADEIISKLERQIDGTGTPGKAS